MPTWRTDSPATRAPTTKAPTLLQNSVYVYLEFEELAYQDLSTEEQQEFMSSIKTAIAVSQGVGLDAVQMSVFSGSTIVEGTVILPTAARASAFAADFANNPSSILGQDIQNRYGSFTVLSCSNSVNGCDEVNSTVDDPQVDFSNTTVIFGFSVLGAFVLGVPLMWLCDAQASPQDAAEVSEQFWKELADVHRTMVAGERSWGIWKEVSRWSFLEENTWISVFGRHRGDFLNSTKRWTILFTMLFAGFGIAAVLSQVLAMDVVVALIVAVIAGPIPFVLRKCFERPPPPEHVVVVNPETAGCCGVWMALLLRGVGTSPLRIGATGTKTVTEMVSPRKPVDLPGSKPLMDENGSENSKDGEDGPAPGDKAAESREEEERVVDEREAISGEQGAPVGRLERAASLEAAVALPGPFIDPMQKPQQQQPHRRSLTGLPPLHNLAGSSQAVRAALSKRARLGRPMSDDVNYIQWAASQPSFESYIPSVASIAQLDSAGEVPEEVPSGLPAKHERRSLSEDYDYKSDDRSRNGGVGDSGPDDHDDHDQGSSPPAGSKYEEHKELQGERNDPEETGGVAGDHRFMEQWMLRQQHIEAKHHPNLSEEYKFETPLPNHHLRQRQMNSGNYEIDMTGRKQKQFADPTKARQAPPPPHMPNKQAVACCRFAVYCTPSFNTDWTVLDVVMCALCVCVMLVCLVVVALVKVNLLLLLLFMAFDFGLRLLFQSGFNFVTLSPLCAGCGTKKNKKIPNNKGGIGDESASRDPHRNNNVATRDAKAAKGDPNNNHDNEESVIITFQKARDLGFRMLSCEVIRVLPGSQADDNGIAEGWKLLAVNGENVKDDKRATKLLQKCQRKRSFTARFQPVQREEYDHYRNRRIRSRSRRGNRNIAHRRRRNQSMHDFGEMKQDYKNSTGEDGHDGDLDDYEVEMVEMQAPPRRRYHHRDSSDDADVDETDSDDVDIEDISVHMQSYHQPHYADRPVGDRQGRSVRFSLPDIEVKDDGTIERFRVVHPGQSSGEYSYYDDDEDEDEIMEAPQHHQ